MTTDITCVLGHCNSPSGCEDSGRCRAAIPAPEGADRDAFEAAYRDAYKVTCEVCHDKFERSASDDYEDVTVMVGWRMWRAALAAQPKDLQKTPNLVQNSSLTPAAQAPAEGDAAAWMHEDDPSRVISAIQKAQAEKDGGASASSVKAYSIRLTKPHPQPKGTTITDDMVMAFHRATTDGALDAEGFADIKAGLTAVLCNAQAPAPAHELTPGEIQALWAPYAGAAPFAFARKIEAAIAAKRAQVQQ